MLPGSAFSSSEKMPTVLVKNVKLNAKFYSKRQMCSLVWALCIRIDPANNKKIHLKSNSKPSSFKYLPRVQKCSISLKQKKQKTVNFVTKCQVNHEITILEEMKVPVLKTFSDIENPVNNLSFHHQWKNIPCSA